MATVLSAGSVLAQTPPQAQTPEQRGQQPEMAATVVEGQLQSVDATTKVIVVKTADGTDETLRYDDDPKVTGGQSGVAGLANSKGTNVSVTLRGSGVDRVAS